jgi:hypothetical protein
MGGMTKKGRKSTPRESAAGRQNLLDWKKKHPEGGAFKHGMYSIHIRKRYADRRTAEGRQLAEIMRGLADDLGGNDKLTSSQRLILDNIKAKIIVIFQISKYVDLQPSIINEKGELLPCLGRNFTGYSEALRRDLMALNEIVGKKGSKTLDLNQYLSEAYGADKEK